MIVLKVKAIYFLFKLENIIQNYVKQAEIFSFVYNPV